MLYLKTHEVDRRGNIFFLVNSMIGAYNRRTDVIGKGMSTIALALSTPNDNSAEVKALTDSLRVEADAFDAVNKSQLDKETFNG